MVYEWAWKEGAKGARERPAAKTGRAVVRVEGELGTSVGKKKRVNGGSAQESSTGKRMAARFSENLSSNWMQV